MDVQPGWSRKGGEALVTCKVIAKRAMKNVDVVWVQRLEGEKDVKNGRIEERDFEIAENDVLHAEYRDWHKYEMVKSKVAKKFQKIYKLKIKGCLAFDALLDRRVSFHNTMIRNEVKRHPSNATSFSSAFCSMLLHLFTCFYNIS